MKIFLSINEFNTIQRQNLAKILGSATLIERQNYDDDAAVESGFKDCEVVFGNVPPDWLQNTQALRWAQLDSVGFGEYRSLDWQQLGSQITLTNLAGFFSDPVAQTALGGILALYRGLDQLILHRLNQRWEGEKQRTQLRTLSGAQIVLFGHGAINRRLEQLLSGFDCAIQTFGKSWTPAQLDAALSQADIVISTVPETDATVGVFSAQRLALLKHDAIFVNCGRGSVVDEIALASMLDSGALYGAVVDVTIDEPLPADHPFWRTPRLLLTQHTGGGTLDELDRKIRVFADNLSRYLNNQPLHNRVDFNRGY